VKVGRIRKEEVGRQGELDGIEVWSGVRNLWDVLRRLCGNRGLCGRLERGQELGRLRLTQERRVGDGRLRGLLCQRLELVVHGNLLRSVCKEVGTWR
jgi:hypothetical protein